MSAAHVDRLLEQLEDLGVELTKEGLRRDADLVGRIWGWTLEAQRAVPKMTNTDGEALELRTAVFRVADAAALASALGARQDILVDRDGTWTWLRPVGPAPGFGENTILGHLGAARRSARGRGQLREQAPARSGMAGADRGRPVRECAQGGT